MVLLNMKGFDCDLNSDGDRADMLALQDSLQFPRVKRPFDVKPHPTVTFVTRHLWGLMYYCGAVIVGQGPEVAYVSPPQTEVGYTGIYCNFRNVVGFLTHDQYTPLVEVYAFRAIANPEIRPHVLRICLHMHVSEMLHRDWSGWSRERMSERPLLICRMRVLDAFHSRRGVVHARAILTPPQYAVWLALVTAPLRSRRCGQNVKRKACEKLDHPGSGKRFLREHGKHLAELVA